MLLDQRPGEGRVPLVVRLGARERGGGFFEGAEPEQALRLGQETARASVLYHGGLPARQVAQRAVAHPRRLQRHVGGLRAAEFTARLLHVGAIRLGGGTHVPRLPQRPALGLRSEEHTSELQSRLHLVCRLLLEKKKKTQRAYTRAIRQVPV